MGRKKKVKTEERTCATCACGPIGDVADCADCTDHDQWAPIEPECDGDSCKISVNGSPPVPFPSKESTEQVSEMVRGHLEDQDGNPKVIRRSFIGEHILEEYADGTVSFDGSPRVTKEAMKTIVEAAQVVKGDKKSTQLDLDMKPAEYPVGVEEESYTVLTFECGSWTLKVREDRLESAAACNNITALVQRRLKAGSELYPLSEGEFDRWVQRFTKSLTNYVRTGCA